MATLLDSPAMRQLTANRLFAAGLTKSPIVSPAVLAGTAPPVVPPEIARAFQAPSLQTAAAVASTFVPAPVPPPAAAPASSVRWPLILAGGGALVLVILLLRRRGAST